MIEFFRALPGHLVAGAAAHPYATTLLVLLVAAFGYGVLLKLKFYLEDRDQDASNRKRYGR